MILMAFVYFLLSISLIYPLGLIIFKDFKLSPIIRSFLSILIISLVVSFTSRLVPSFTREIIFLILFISYIYICLNFQYFISAIPVLNLKSFSRCILFILIFGLILFDINPYVYRFEAHDIHIFGPTIEIFNSDYNGNIRNPLSYPQELSSYHTLPGIFIGVSSFLNPSLTLVDLIIGKYLILIIFFGGIFYEISSPLKYKLIYLASLLLIIYFFKETIYYELSISSYLFAITLSIIGAVSLKDDLHQDEHISILFCLLLSLMAMKIPIFYVLIPSLVYLFLRFFKILFSATTFIFCTLIFLNFLIIYLIPTSSKIGEVVSYSIMNPFDLDSLRSLAGLWFVESRTLDILTIDFGIGQENFLFGVSVNSLASLILKLLIIIIFYYSLAFIFLKAIKQQAIRKTIRLFLLSSFLGWIFVRNNGNMDLQTHLYFLSVFLTIVIVPYFLSQDKFLITKKQQSFIFLVVGISLLDILRFGPSLSGNSLNYRDENSLHFSEILDRKSATSSDRYPLNVFLPFWHHEILSQIDGQRIYLDDLKDLKIKTDDSYLIDYVIETE